MQSLMILYRNERVHQKISVTKIQRQDKIVQNMLT